MNRIVFVGNDGEKHIYSVAGAGAPLRHVCPEPDGGQGFGTLSRCACGQLWVFIHDNVAWAGWVPAGRWARLRAWVGRV